MNDKINLVQSHPLRDKLAKIVLDSWNSIFESQIGNYKIGIDIFPQPQIMGFILHELIPLYLSAENDDYKCGDANNEKDIHCISDVNLSIEIKTSSDKSKIFGNRSYAQEQTKRTKKSKDGYYLTVNFEKFTDKTKRPEILLIRFGYLEHSDWIGQSSPTGQQARLDSSTYKNKFITLYQRKTSQTSSH